MGLVVLRGAIYGQIAANVAMEAIAAMLVFMCVGGVAGWIADHLVRDSLEKMFHGRVDWYRQGMIDAGFIDPKPPKD